MWCHAKPFSQSPYHLVRPRPWPILSGFGAGGLAWGLVIFFHRDCMWGLYYVVFPFLIFIATQWWRDVSREGTYLGAHNKIVIQGLRWGVVLFIISEVIFFSAFFWAFFHRSFIPDAELGCFWPPEGLKPLNPFSVPLLNTAVLLASGVAVTWRHHCLIQGNLSGAKQGLALTIFLGVYFTWLQLREYRDTSYNIADRVYGSGFFVATGFHGVHVLIGRSFLGVCLYRIFRGHFGSIHHFGFEAAVWYWHFVDVVWLFLFVCIYWWGR